MIATFIEITTGLVSSTIACSAESDNALERIRLMSAAFYDYTMSHREETRVLIEAVSAARDKTMRRVLKSKFSELLGVIQGVLDEGVRQGAFKGDLDLALVAWEIMSLGVTLHLASLLGLDDILTREKAMAAVDRLLASISTVSGKGEEP